IPVLEEARRVAGQGKIALDASLDELDRATQRLQALQGADPTSLELAAARQEVSRLEHDAEAARRKIRRAKEELDDGAIQTAFNLGNTINDPLVDSNRGLQGLRHLAREFVGTTGGSIISSVNGLAPIALAQSELGRQGMEEASDALSLLSFQPG